MTTPIILLRDLDLVKTVAIERFDNFINHRIVIDEDCDAFTSQLLLIAKGSKWKEMRKAMAPTFRSSRVNDMSVHAIEAAKQMQRYFQDLLREKESKNNDAITEVEGKHIFTLLLNDIIALAMFGTSINSFEDGQNEFLKYSLKMNYLGVKNILKVFGFSNVPKLMKFFNIDIIEKETAAYFTEILISKIRERKANSTIASDVIDMMKNWSDGLCKSQAGIFIIGGIETTAIALANICYELAINQDIQKRLQAEIDGAIATHGELTYDVIKNMDYLTMVVSESLRKYPAGPPISDRICQEDFDIGPPRPGAKTYTLKKGDAIGISSHCIHGDPKYWSNPNKFDPERFSKENRSNIIPLSYMPYGIGPRNCIGFRFGEMSLKIGIVFMMSAFDVLPTEKTPNVLRLYEKGFLLKSNAYYYALKLRQTLNSF